MPSNRVKPVVDLRRTAGGLAIFAAIFYVGWCEVRLVKWGCGKIANVISSFDGDA